MAEYKDELLDHEYDGIKEMDNDLPRWWLYLFYVSIIWAFLYMIFFHVLDIGYLQEDQYRKEMDPAYVRVQAGGTKVLGLLSDYRSPYYNPRGDQTPRARYLAQHSGSPLLAMTRETDTTTYEMLTDATLIASGGETFQKNCAQCHGKLGEGGVGPNLTDNYWLHGADMTSVVKTVKYGFPAKGMIAWRGTLSEDEIVHVAGYVISLKGTNPPNGKAPQGELVAE